ncbi:MAG TPA: hypothetical protein GX687_00400 [Clostridia bacterium]|nr:hypothetical protein [Clostridia bacterium]
MSKSIFLLFFFFLVYLAIKSQKKLQKQRKIKELEKITDSPFSYVIAELVAVAGGIYLALLLLVTFLEISLPERLVLYDWSLDFLATLALLLALLQPIFLALYYKIGQWF